MREDSISIRHTKKKFISCALITLLICQEKGVAQATSPHPLLPSIEKIREQRPSQKSVLLDRQGRVITEYFDQYRTYLPFSAFPPKLVEAFLAAEDESFYKHKGISPQAILRALMVNTQSGESLQGGSTITQQLAKNLLLSNEKSFVRKMKEAVIAYHLEKNLSKNEILELYLNQIFLGENSYGVEAAAQTYFRKSLAQLSVPEFALLAGLPKAPSRDNPVANPAGAMERQRYVLRRMKNAGHITEQEFAQYSKTPLRIYKSRSQSKMALYYSDLVRQILKLKIGEDRFQQGGLRIETGLDLDLQRSAENSLKQGLLEVDKRQGFRESPEIFENEEAVDLFLKQNSLTQNADREQFILTPEGQAMSEGDYLKKDERLDKQFQQKKTDHLKQQLGKGEWVWGVVRQVRDAQNEVVVEAADFWGILPLDEMKWARKPDPSVSLKFQEIKKPSMVFKPLMRIQVQVKSWKKEDPRQLLGSSIRYDKPLKEVALVSLQQEPKVEGALLSFDLKAKEIVALVGGYDFQKSQFNRAVSARRQAGSVFKMFILAHALEKGIQSATLLADTPVVAEDDWRPQNHDRKFSGEVLTGVAFLRSLNLPFVKVLNEIGIPSAIGACRKMGFFSPLNPDDTLVLGSSNVTLYETLRALSEMTLLGQPLNPVLVRKVTGPDGQIILQNYTMDDYYYDFMPQFQASMRSPARALQETTADIMTRLLQLTTRDPEGTAGKAGALPFPVAGKTGTSSDYFDAWFVGGSAHLSAAVWVGFDEERSLGIGETGGRASLPIWMNYMKEAHKNLPRENFLTSAQVIDVEVDRKTGLLPNLETKQRIKLPFVKGTEPKSTQQIGKDRSDEMKEF